MNISPRIPVLFIAIVFAVFPVTGLEYTAGNYHLSINEESGRFSLSYQHNRQRVPLFFSDNSHTSYLSFKYGDSVVRLGDEKQIVLSIQEFNDAVNVQYDWANLRIEMKFTFPGSPESGKIQGLAIDYTISNRGNKSFSSGLRQIIDTTLGESSSAHFSTAMVPAVVREYALNPNRNESSIVSSNEQIGLEFFLSSGGATPPRKVVAANWKRLNESSWEYEAREDRNFNLLPFSINDSALVIYYGPRELKPRDTVTYRLIMSAYTGENRTSAAALSRAMPMGFVLDTTKSAVPMRVDFLQTSKTAEPAEEWEFSPGEINGIRPYIQDIKSVDVLSAQIDRLLDSRSSPGREEVEALRQILEMIQQNLE